VSGSRCAGAMETATDTVLLVLEKFRVFVRQSWSFEQCCLQYALLQYTHTHKHTHMSARAYFDFHRDENCFVAKRKFGC
jgi:hypothetical protein